MQATKQYIREELTGLYAQDEIESFIRIIIEYVCGWSFTEQVLKKDDLLGQEENLLVKKIIFRLKQFEPIQYILGHTEFLGLNLKVDRSVLIPRPETEELVNWIIETNQLESPKILDIGTGSGCIPLVLKKHIKKAEISAVDISEGALKTAQQNCIQNNLEVKFFAADILNWENQDWDEYDIIVSNPPYVREVEKKEMLQNVLEYEPASALFVPDSNPLIFYQRIAGFAQKYLRKGGMLFFEINEFLANDTYNLLKESRFVHIEIRKDMNQKKRMIACRRKN